MELGKMGNRRSGWRLLCLRTDPGSRTGGVGRHGRVGFVHYNEPTEIERLARALREIAVAAAHPPA
jgi:selenocysteine lyase/cysteine desulfurase